jgi:hypothetical protein
MGVLVKNGKLITIDGKLIKSTGGSSSGGSGGSSIPLFAPKLSASDKTITLNDSNNGAYVEKYRYYINNDMKVETTSKSMSAASYLDGNEEQYNLYAKAAGLLSDSDKSNAINYYRVLFKNQDEQVLRTQIELENNSFTYDGTEPVYEGNFYGWNTDKSAQTREPILQVSKPTTYYAIYTSDFADSVVKVCSFIDSGYSKQLYATQIDDIAYILLDNLVYKFDPSSVDKTPIEIGKFGTMIACADGRKIYTFNNVSSVGLILHVFNVDTCQSEEDIPLSLSHDWVYQRPFAVKDNFVYFLADTKTKNQDGADIYNIIKYDLATHTYTVEAELYGDGFIEMKMFGSDIYIKNRNYYWWFNINSKNVKKVAGDYDTDCYGTMSVLNGKAYTYDSVGRMLEYDIGSETINPPTIMSSTLDIDNYLYGYMACVTIGNAIYFFGNYKIQKYY